MKNAKHFIGTLRHNKVFKRVLSVVLSLTMLIGVVQIIAAALPDDIDVSFSTTSKSIHFRLAAGIGGSIDTTVNFGDLGTVTIDESGKKATATPVPEFGHFTGEYAPKFVCWTKGDSLDNIYSYSNTIEPKESGEYFAWFTSEVHYVGQKWTSYASGTSALRKYATSDSSIVSLNSNTSYGDGYRADIYGVGSGAAVIGWDTITLNKNWYTAIIVLPGPASLDMALQGSPNYELAEFPVTLFDYDINAFNDAHPRNNPETLNFWGAGNYTSPPKDSYVNEGRGPVAAQGIFKENLVNGLPVPTEGDDTELFSTSEGVGKQIYEDVSFQFIKNKNTGWYEYNSSISHAQYDNESRSVKLYYENLAASEDTAAGFFPFDDINSAAVNGSGDFVFSHRTFSEWENAYATHASDYKGTYVDNSANLQNGMVMDFDFYLPENGTVDGTVDGEQIQFEFSGDDDMWVFVDDKLVLDIGGGHNPVSGNINFATGKATVESAITREDSNPIARTVDVNLAQDEYHNIKIFYLERFGGESNCRISFNLPAVPQKSITVEKDMTDPDGNSVSTNDTFSFKLETADERTGTYNVITDRTYDVVDAKNPTVIIAEDVAVGNDGIFTIKTGQKAVFESFDSTEFYKVTEIISEEMQGRYSKVVVDGLPSISPDGKYTSIPRQVTNKGSSVKFTNILTDPLAGATLSKTSEAIGNNQYKIILSITGATPDSSITVTDTVSKYFDIVSPQNGDAGALVSDQTITFNGMTASDGSWTGEIIIVPKADFWGGNSVPTNDGNAVANSAAKIAHNFTGSPTVDVQLNLPALTGNNKTIYLGETAPTFSELFTGQDAFTVPSDESDPDYWKTAFANVSEITYFPVAVDATKSGTYSAYVTVTPKLDGTVQAQTVTANADLTVKTCTLTITKRGGESGSNYIFKLSGVGNDLASAVNTVVSVGNDGTVTIKGLPIGTYTVTEDSGWSWRYGADEKKVELSPTSDAASVTVVNERVNGNWLDAEDVVTNNFN